MQILQIRIFLIESGDHASLTALGGKYAQLVKQQSLDTVDVKATA